MTKSKKQSKKARHNTGRPTKYRAEYCDHLVQFFSGPRHEMIEKAHISGKNDYEKTEFMRVACELPTFAKFARSIGVNGDTIVEWASARHSKEHPTPSLRGKLKHPDFSAAYNEAKELQREFLVDNGLAGLYPPASFIFTAKNIADMRDKQEIDHTSGGEPIKGFNYIVPKNDPDAAANP